MRKIKRDAASIMVQLPCKPVRGQGWLRQEHS